MIELVKQFPGFSFLGFLFVLGVIHSLIIASINKNRPETTGPTAIAQVTKAILTDVFALLSFMITGAIIFLVLSNKDVPPILTYGATGVFSAHFGKLTEKIRKE